MKCMSILCLMESSTKACSQIPALKQRSFACYSFGKTYHSTGWKMGYCIAPEALMKEFRKAHQFSAFSTNTPMQAGLATILEDEQLYADLGSDMQRKRDFFLQQMKGSPFDPLPSSGSYFQCFSYVDYSREPDQQLAMRLVKEAGVAAIPLSAFYHDGTDNHVLRFCFAKQEKTLQQAACRLRLLR